MVVDLIVLVKYFMAINNRVATLAPETYKQVGSHFFIPISWQIDPGELRLTADCMSLLLARLNFRFQVFI